MFCFHELYLLLVDLFNWGCTQKYLFFSESQFIIGGIPAAVGGREWLFMHIS